MWEAFQHAALGGPRQPDRDHRRQPARPDARDDARLGPRRLRRAASRRSAGTRSRSTATTSRRSRRPTTEAERDQRPARPRSSPAPKKGKGVKAVEDQPGKHGKPLDDPEAAIAELGGERDLHVTSPKPPDGRAARRSTTPAGELPTWELGDEVATRNAYGEALAALGDARGDVVALDGEVVQLHALRGLPRGPPRPLLRDVHRRAAARRGRGRACRCAAGCRSPRRSRRSSPAPTTSSAWRRSRGPTSAWPAPTPACRSARTARRRWRSRTWPRSARSTARPCCYPS